VRFPVLCQVGPKEGPPRRVSRAAFTGHRAWLTDAGLGGKSEAERTAEELFVQHGEAEPHGYGIIRGLAVAIELTEIVLRAGDIPLRSAPRVGPASV
jgi:hypothetical protein